MFGFVDSCSSPPLGAAERTINNGVPAPSPPKTKRSRWLEGKLYPDNPYHITLLGYFANCGFYQGCYIMHDRDVDESGNLKKAHWHVVLYDSYNLRTCVYVGDGRYIAKQWCKSFGTFDALVDKTGKPYCYLPADGYRDLSPVCGDVKTFPIVEDFAAINDVPVFLAYLTHSDFKSVMRNKFRYPITDINFIGESPTVKAHFADVENERCGVFSEIRCYAEGLKSPRQLLDILLEEGRFDLVEFCRKNPHFVSKFFFD